MDLVKLVQEMDNPWLNLFLGTLLGFSYGVLDTLKDRYGSKGRRKKPLLVMSGFKITFLLLMFVGVNTFPLVDILGCILGFSYGSVYAIDLEQSILPKIMPRIFAKKKNGDHGHGLHCRDCGSSNRIGLDTAIELKDLCSQCHKPTKIVATVGDLLNLSGHTEDSNQIS